MDGILSDIVAIIIGLTDHVSALDSRTCHKRCKTPGVVVPTVVVSRQSALRIDGSPELPSPDDERIFKEPALFEIIDQGFGRLVGIAALKFDRVGQTSVVVPPHVKQLDESYVSLGQSAG
jgi:hypothetical protein